MPVMPDHWIREQARNAAMIEPFVEEQKREGVISYGLSSYGYDARCADHFKVFTNVDSAIVDPKQRALAMKDVEQILQDSAVMVQPFWSDRFGATAKNVHGFRLHPSTYTSLFNTWLS